MAKKKSTINAKAVKRKDGAAKNVEVYEHIGAKRLNNPQVGLVNTKTEKIEQKKKFSFDPHLEPNLIWSSKSERHSFEIPTVSLHVHERMDPRSIIDSVKKSPEKIWQQMNLFNRPINKLSFVKEIEFYKHEKDWSNRMIAGDSLLVANSLLEKEAFGGKVQMIYFDPPYGIKYGSNFQPFVNKKEVKDGKDEDLNLEPEMIRAFRDTWELGIHSYLSYIRDRLLLFRELLSDSGSLFFQISDENLHLVRNIIDEIFGAKNLVGQITFKKTHHQESVLLPSVCDYIIWVAKDKSQVKYRAIRPTRNLEDMDTGKFKKVEMPDGSIRPISDAERDNPGLIPDGCRLFRDDITLTQDGESSAGQEPWEIDGKTFYPGAGRHWRTSLEGRKVLLHAGRVVVGDKRPFYKAYWDDTPPAPYNNIWTDMAGAQDKVYCVQTNIRAIERCILSSTDPGDLIFDPTCGSGTTAVASEKWGRRWITCDTSRVALALAKQRLMTQVFDYYRLQNSDEGVDSGFILKSVPHITLGSISNNQRLLISKDKDIIAKLTLEGAAKIDLYDQPEVDREKARVSGPFTVEAVPAPVVRELNEESSQYGSRLNGQADWISELLKSGIRSKGKKYLNFSRLEPIPGTKWLHADGNTDEEIPQRVVVSFGPDFAPLEQRQVELAIQEIEKLKPSPTVVVFAAFQFDPEAAKDIDELEWGGVTILKAQMNTDLFTEDLKKKKTGSEGFWLVGQPDLKIDLLKTGSEKGKYQVTVKGFDYYNPKTGAVDSGDSSQIAMWMLDTDYDGRSILPKQVFFPMSGAKDGWTRLTRALKNEIDADLIESFHGTVSLPFELGENKKIAVKIIDDRGIESLLVQELE